MFGLALAYALSTAPPANPAIDMRGHLTLAQAAALHRESRRVSEAEFLRFSTEPGTVVLDARSRPMYERLHVRAPST